ncbi:hypothetical protein CIB84_004211, partial [Bambusicola thoracicus]
FSPTGELLPWSPVHGEPQLWATGFASATPHRLCLCTGSCQFCPAGWLWHAGRCYYFSSAKRIWEQGKEDCCSRGAQLVIIRDNSTLAFLTHVSHMDIFHVGLKRSPSRFEWKWLDGTVLKG